MLFINRQAGRRNTYSRRPDNLRLCGFFTKRTVLHITTATAYKTPQNIPWHSLTTHTGVSPAKPKNQ